MRLLVALFVLTVCAGCTSSRVSSQPQPVQPPPPGAPAAVVWIRGEVKNSVLPWTEELTVARAIVAADYTGIGDPYNILLIRQGQTRKINPRDLVKGRDDAVLEPGDMIVIER